MVVETIPSAVDWQGGASLRIEFLFVDLTRCTRCLGADRNIGSALELVSDVLAATGVEVEVEKILVESEEQARTLRFVTSPTIRINGTDLALELRESSCGSEACTDGCGEQIECRVWVYRGEEYTEPPVAMIVEAILGHLYGRAAERCQARPEPYVLPDNLARFFAGKAAPTSNEAGSEAAEGGCCSPSEQETCCEPAAKESCCGGSTSGGCGCR